MVAQSNNIADSLRQFYREHDLGIDGGRHERFARVKMGWFTFYFPNTSGRKRALEFHDIHHLVMGYDTSLQGEAQIGAWEVGSGCRDFYVAWILNLLGLAMGLVICPRQTFQAFCRGRRSQNLYHDVATREEISRMTIAQVHQLLAPKDEVVPPTAGDIASFVGWSAVALALAIGPVIAAAAIAIAIWVVL